MGIRADITIMQMIGSEEDYLNKMASSIEEAQNLKVFTPKQALA